MEENNIDRFKSIIANYIKKDLVNHAYLIETNYTNRLDIARELIKYILSFENNVTIEELEKNGDLIIIDNDTNIIKTEEIEIIKEKFSTKSLLNSKRIYVINGAEKLNNYSANKLLKFLEEPEDDIVAILLTENKNNVINTVISRCFNIRFFVQNQINYDEEYVDKLFDFVLNIEENKEKAIAFQNRLYLNDLSDRTYLKKFLNDLLLVYDDVIQYKICKQCIFFTKQIEKIKKICEDNNINEINLKINSINICIERLVFNPNTKLLIDKLIILMSGVDVDA